MPNIKFTLFTAMAAVVLVTACEDEQRVDPATSADSGSATNTDAGTTQDTDGGSADADTGASSAATFNAAYCPETFPQDFNPANVNFSKRIDLEPITPGFAILEGPVWRNDQLYVSHIGYSIGGEPNPADLLVVDSSTVTTLRSDFGSNGLTLDVNGTIYAARHKTGAVEMLEGGTAVTDTFMGVRYNSPNDLVFSSTGNLYFTDPSWQAGDTPSQAEERAYFVDSLGEVTPFASNLERPNGVFLSLNEERIYVGGVNGLYSFELDTSGAPSETSQRIRDDIIPGNVDGLSRDCAGNLYITAGGKLIVLAGDNYALLGSFDIEGITNVAFGGVDGRTLYATSLGERPALWEARVDIPGLPF